MIPALRQISVVLGAVACLVAACSNGQPGSFAVTGASVDPTYSCPGGANNARYGLHATVNVRNGTSHTVTIQSVSAEMKLVAVQGTWLEKVGDLYDAGDGTFSPSSVVAGSNAALNVTITSACTSDRYESGRSSRGDYAVTLHLLTSAGQFSVTANNRHEIRGA